MEDGQGFSGKRNKNTKGISQLVAVGAEAEGVRDQISLLRRLPEAAAFKRPPDWAGDGTAVRPSPVGG